VTALDVCIVSYRSRDMLRDCLESLYAHPPTCPMNVRVVDNDSRDGTAELVRERFPQVDLVASRENLGFGKATNLLIGRGSAPYVLALNPDTRMTPQALDTLLELMESRPEVGIAGCRLVLEDGSEDHAAKRSFPTIAGSLGHFTGVGRRADAHPALAQYRAPDVQAGPVDCVNGAFMLMRRAALDDVGHFDEGFWMYMEDIDLCYRFVQAGWTVWYEPSATVVHVKWGSSGKVRSARLTYAFHYGMYRFYRKHYAPRRSVLTNAAVYAGIGAKCAWSIATAPLRRRLTRPGSESAS
jgi:N-acetylglucosaminyl-diphospho-decaprenol L-rhamnosyltransferase